MAGTIFGVRESTTFAKAMAQSEGIRIKESSENLTPHSTKDGTIHIGSPSLYNHEEYIGHLHREIGKQVKDMKYFHDAQTGEEGLQSVSRDILQAHVSEHNMEGDYIGRDRILKQHYATQVKDNGGMTEVIKAVGEDNKTLGALMYWDNEVRNDWQGYNHCDVPDELKDEVERLSFLQDEIGKVDDRDSLETLLHMIETYEPPPPEGGQGDSDEESEDDEDDQDSDGSDEGSGEGDGDDASTAEEGDDQDAGDEPDDSDADGGDQDGEEQDSGSEDADGGDEIGKVDSGEGDESDPDGEDEGDTEEGSGGEDRDGESEVSPETEGDDGEGEGNDSNSGGQDSEDDGGDGTDEQGTSSGVGATEASTKLKDMGFIRPPVDKVQQEERNEVPYIPENNIETRDLTATPRGERDLSGRYGYLWKDAITNRLGSFTLSKRVRKYLITLSQTGYEYGLKRGKVCNKNISRIYSGAKQPRIFKAKQATKIQQDTAMFILGDCSGSMAGEEYVVSAACQVALSECMQSLQIPHMMMQFSTGGIPIHHIMKKFEERSVSRDKLIERYSDGEISFGCNADGEAVSEAAQMLGSRPEANKILVVLSDGHPAYGGNNGQYLKDVVKDIEGSGKMHILGIGIQSDAVTSYYSDCQVVSQLQDLERVLIDLLRTKILK